MAFLVQHKKSPFWYVRRRDLDSGDWREASTKLRIDSASDTRKAQRLADKYTTQEKQLGSARNNPAFAAWVPAYLAAQYASSKGSLKRYTTAWGAISAFLKAERIAFPRQIRYTHGAAYVAWRRVNKVYGRSVGHNTALLEAKFLAQLIGEAVKREFAEANPLAHLGIARAPQKIKPELSDAEIETVRKELETWPTWAQRAFQISLYTGCRFSEASIPVENIDLAGNAVRIRDAKRKENDPRKYFSIPIHPKLRPLFEQVIASGEAVTCTLSGDKNGRINQVFSKVGASFHSLRVTFVTRCHRAGLSESEAMRLVNHSSQLVHRIYSRMNVDDVRSAQARIQLP